MGTERENQTSILIHPDILSHLPVAFALIKATKKTESVEHLTYEYVNDRFCEWSFKKREDFIGKEVAEAYSKSAEQDWVNCLRQIEADGKAIKGSSYYAPFGGFVDYIISPTQEKGIYAVMYLNSAIKSEEYDSLNRDKQISEKILDFATKVSAGVIDERSLTGLLKEIADFISAKRVYFVRFGKQKGIYAAYKSGPEVADPLPPTFEAVDSLLPYAEKTGEPLILDAQKAKEGDPVSAAFLDQGISTHMAFPFLNEGRLIACLCADDYPKESESTAKRILQSCCYFLSYKWSNNVLLDKLRYRARHDSLTGLLNRYGADEALGKYIKENPNDPCVLALVDIDDFKNTNDLYGHIAGDNALKAISSDIVSFFGEKAICSRFGGDEICFLLPGKDLKEAGDLISKFKEKRHCFSCQKGEKEISFSVGYVEYPRQGSDLPSIVAKADSACYAAKLSGKGCCYAYAESFDSLDKTSFGFSFHAIADAMPIPFILFGNKGELYYANARCLKLFGYPNLLSMSTCCKEGIFDLFEEKDALMSCIASNDAKECSIDITLKSGKAVKLVFAQKADMPESVHYAVIL